MSFRKVVRRSNGMLRLLARHTRPADRHKRQPLKQKSFGTSFDCPVIPFLDLKNMLIQSPPKTNVVFNSLIRRCFPKYSSDTVLNSGGGWARDLIIADWHDIENYVAPDSRKKIHVQRSRNQDIAGFKFHCADWSLRLEGHAHRQTLRQQRVESFDAGGVPSTLARRGVTLSVRNV